MDAVDSDRWICHERRPARSPFDGSRSDGWHMHVLGCVRLRRREDTIAITFDGRLFGWDLCDRLLVELDRLEGLISRFDFAVWTGPTGDGNGDGAGWIHHSAAGTSEACAFARQVATVVTATDQGLSIRTITLRLERLLMERRGVFDDVLAAWLLDRTPGNATLGRLFEPGRETADEGLKVVRRFGDNLTFDAYRAATAHVWIEDQRARMTGGDLGMVLDRRLARSLMSAVSRTHRAGEPVLERVSGVFMTSRGSQFEEYYRLLLPLSDRTEEHAGSVLIATQW